MESRKRRHGRYYSRVLTIPRRAKSAFHVHGKPSGRAGPGPAIAVVIGHPANASLNPAKTPFEHNSTASRLSIRNPKSAKYSPSPFPSLPSGISPIPARTATRRGQTSPSHGPYRQTDLGSIRPRLRHPRLRFRRGLRIPEAERTPSLLRPENLIS